MSIHWSIQLIETSCLISRWFCFCCSWFILYENMFFSSSLSMSWFVHVVDLNILVRQVNDWMIGYDVSSFLLLFTYICIVQDHRQHFTSLWSWRMVSRSDFSSLVTVINYFIIISLSTDKLFILFFAWEFLKFKIRIIYIIFYHKISNQPELYRHHYNYTFIHLLDIHFQENGFQIQN